MPLGCCVDIEPKHHRALLGAAATRTAFRRTAAPRIAAPGLKPGCGADSTSSGRRDPLLSIDVVTYHDDEMRIDQNFGVNILNQEGTLQLEHVSNGRDQFADNKFTTPTIANVRVYVRTPQRPPSACYRSNSAVPARA